MRQHRKNGIDVVFSEEYIKILTSMEKTQVINEKLITRDPMALVASMHSIRHRAEEIILTELICK